MSNAWPEQTLSKRKPFDFIDRLREISTFFEGTDKVHQTMRRVAHALNAAGIPFVIVGGMAVNAHEHERTTRDVDFLVTTEGSRPSVLCFPMQSSRACRAARVGFSTARPA